jgi:RHS repeat-associated protein
MRISKKIVLIVSLITCQISFSQTIGGRDNSEQTPKAAEATKLSGGTFTGDVNTMTGEFASSIQLGSVSTPSGLGYSLSLDYNSSFSMSATQPMTAGIPYGDGWGPNLPTVSIETDVFHKFSCGELDMFSGTNVNDLNFGDGVGGWNGSDESDLYWFSPMVNIPGVASGRAVFKYVDVADQKCLVFVLNKFETSVEVRFYGHKGWEIRLANGNTYKIGTHLANYRAPSSQRVLFYNQDGQSGILNPADPQNQAAVNNDYGTHAPSVQNAVEPKSSYSVWYCDKIYNTNFPDQIIGFRYNKFGEFNFFEEFNQTNYEAVRSDVFNSSTNTDFSAYTDVFLKEIYSAVSETPVDIVELEYGTYSPAVDNATILSLSDPLVFQKDGLYNYKVVEEWDSNFDTWKRYKHVAAIDNTAGFNQSNPYLTSSSPHYQNENIPAIDEVPFNHGYLESDRLYSSGSGYYPGDIYEIKTIVSRDNSFSHDMGNGTLDIAIKSGNWGNGPSSETGFYNTDGTNLTNADFQNRKGIEIFSTFNSAAKWQMGHGQAQMETSNLFVMPNIPSTYFGFNLQIGPGNSDIDFSGNTSDNLDMINSNDLSKIKAMEAYPFRDLGRMIKSTNQISHSFGTGHPWGMMIPEYNKMALNGSNASYDNLYETWWATPLEVLAGRDNLPTKFDSTVHLDKVQLIRYSKNALMLQNVKVYKVNGEFKGLQDPTLSGWQLVSQKKLDYTHESETIIRNYNYGPLDSIRTENNGLLRKVIMLNKITDLPVTGAVPTNLTTFLEYEKFLDTEVNPNPVYDDKKPYNGLNQYLLTSYIDHLGGITRVEYYPVDDSSTRIQNNYSFSSCDNYIYNPNGNNALSAKPFGKGTNYTVHAAVHYLSKNDEGDELLNSSNVLLGNNSLNPDLKVWEYVFDVNTLMRNPQKIDLPQAHFRSHYLFGEDVSFKSVRVYSPFVNSTDVARNYTDYEYYGDVPETSFDLPTTEEYLYYGKLKSVKNYSFNDQLEDETIYNYEHTLAFENGYERPNFMRERLWYEDLVFQNYEYQDIHEGAPLVLNHVTYIHDTIWVDPQETIIDSLVIVDSNVMLNLTGPDAYPFVNVPNLSGNYTDKEKPKFLEFYFYNELLTENVGKEYMFHSYFVKKASETNRVYDNSLSILPTPNPPIIGVLSMPVNDPVGAGFTNPRANDEEGDSQYIEMIGQEDEEQLESDFIDNSPLSDAVLVALVKSSVRSTHQTNILNAQSNLSNAVWYELILNKRNFSTFQLASIIDGQSSLYDQVQMDFLNLITNRDDYVLVNAILQRNGFLSGQVVDVMLDPATSMPAESYSDVLSSQPQMPESVLIDIIDAANTKSINLNGILSGQFITTVMYSHILTNTTYTSENVTELIEGTSSFPVDITLIEIIEHLPEFSIVQLERIFARADRDIGDDVEARFALYYPAQLEVLGGVGIANSLSKYCGGSVVSGRSYIETLKEFEYYEADYTGRAVGPAYEVLLGLRENVLSTNPFPFITDPVAEGLSEPVEVITGLTLKHEPSWQLFSVKTSSPQMKDAYSREEYFYLYDLKNRYDRHWYYYDLDNPEINFFADEYTYGTGASAISQVLVTNDKWDSYYKNQLVPILPAFDGMDKTRKSGDRMTAFQKTSISKNTRDTDPVYKSELYQYDSRWTFDDVNGNAQSIQFSDTCISPTTPSTNEPCIEYADCNDCISVFYKPFLVWADIVPMGYCAWFIPNEGYYVCPSDHDVLADHPTATNLYCEIIPQANFALQPGTALANTLQLRDVLIQVDDSDHSVAQEFEDKKLDSKNSYIAEFYLGSPLVDDANNFDAPHHMIVPFDHLKVRTIKERNRYLQVELEEDAVGLQTKYFFNSNTWLWNVDVACPANNYTSRENIDIGLPTQIVVGYTKPDALATNFEYTPIGLVQKVTESNGKTMDYSFDAYNRLLSVTEDGTRLLSTTEYNTWNHDNLLSFDDRIDLNYVEAKSFNSNEAFDYERSKAFVDPLARNQGVVRGYDLDGYNHVSIHSGFQSYDNWGRTTSIEKVYANSLSSSTIINPALSKSQAVSNTVEASILEGGVKGRPLRTSNYGVDVNGIHAIKTNYQITNNIYASCELGLSLYELEQVMTPNGTANFRVYRTEVFDQDDKQSIEYVNALGQAVAQLKYNDGGQKIVTLFAYDSYGNLTKVINPEKQESDYVYNKLGQLVIENTVDAGNKHYMYNKQGVVSVTLDEQGRENTNDLSVADPFYRVYQYDDYGRLTKQGRSTIDGEFHSMTFNGDLYGPLHYQDATVGSSGNVIQDPLTGNYVYFDYTFSDFQTQDWLYQLEYNLVVQGAFNVTLSEGLDAGEMSVDFKEKIMSYGASVGTNELGKVVQSLSFDEGDQQIQSVDYLYDLYGNVKKQTVSFNPDDANLGGEGLINSVIEYPDYNYKHSLLEQKIDVNNDGTTDFHCFMEYDALNRLEAIYGAAGLVSSSSGATLLVSYSYDDAIGAMKKKVHYIKDHGLSAIASEISYQYDERDRLTNVNAGQLTAGMSPMMDYDLFYDDDLVNYDDGVYSATAIADQNWNGNINGTSASYDFTSNISFANNVTGFDLPTLYGYKYDGINRMTSADATVGDLLDAGNLAESNMIGDVTLMYDRIGNIQSLHRTMRNIDVTPLADYTMLQHFNYLYGSNNNRLVQATGVAASGTASRNYTYDNNGNVLTDDSKNLIASEYCRASYPTKLTVDPDNDPQTLDNETISYLYSTNDLRVYKKDEVYNYSTSAYESHEDYYLMDAMGRTVAIFKKGFNGDGWEYYAHGGERETRILPTAVQVPGPNSTLTDTTQMQITKDQATFYVNDHLGNTRITYTPTDIYGTANLVVDDHFHMGSWDLWMPNEATITNVANQLQIVTNASANSPIINKVLSNTDLLQGQTYVLSLNADLGNTPNGVTCEIINAGVSVELMQGVNSIPITINYSSSSVNPVVVFKVTGYNGEAVSYTYTLDDITIGQQTETYTKNTINYVADYFPYGKAVREFVNSDRERYISTQHERDAETGFDYRGARYYDSDVARFLSLDPLAADFVSWSDYNYVMGNPLAFIDPDGKRPIKPRTSRIWFPRRRRVEFAGGSVIETTTLGDFSRERAEVRDILRRRKYTNNLTPKSIENRLDRMDNEIGIRSETRMKLKKLKVGDQLTIRRRFEFGEASTKTIAINSRKDLRKYRKKMFSDNTQFKQTKGDVVAISISLDSRAAKNANKNIVVVDRTVTKSLIPGKTRFKRRGRMKNRLQ